MAGTKVAACSMRGEAVQISWHDGQPVLSIDIQSTKDGTLRFATGGADNAVNIWFLHHGSTEFRASLKRHSKAVNVVRFSPNGTVLASGGDDGTILVWRQLDSNPLSLLDESEVENKEAWTVLRCLRGISDVYDLAWSPDSLFLLCGNTDNTTLVWDIETGKVVQKLEEHRHYVQGVAWNPWRPFIATQSADRTCRLYSVKSKTSGGRSVVRMKSKNVVSHLRAVVPSAVGPISTDTNKGSINRLYLDEGAPSFFRRLSWSPDGLLLLTPMGLQQEKGLEPRYSAFLFAYPNFHRPAITLPCNKPAIVTRFSRRLYKLRGETKTSTFALPYRMLFAVCTLDTVVIYDTQHAYPLFLAADLHCAPLSDLAWSEDDKNILISSTDGYCSIINLADKEFGEPLSKEEQDTMLQPVLAKV
jgi:chromatin assembly factor 1 subunit B